MVVTIRGSDRLTVQVLAFDEQLSTTEYRLGAFGFLAGQEYSDNGGVLNAGLRKLVLQLHRVWTSEPSFLLKSRPAVRPPLGPKAHPLLRGQQAPRYHLGHLRRRRLRAQSRHRQRREHSRCSRAGGAAVPRCYWEQCFPPWTVRIQLGCCEWNLSSHVGGGGVCVVGVLEGRSVCCAGQCVLCHLSQKAVSISGF